jgi:hypothetical protein
VVRVLRKATIVPLHFWGGLTLPNRRPEIEKTFRTHRPEHRDARFQCGVAAACKVMHDDAGAEVFPLETQLAFLDNLFAQCQKGSVGVLPRPGKIHLIDGLHSPGQLVFQSNDPIT